MIMTITPKVLTFCTLSFVLTVTSSADNSGKYSELASFLARSRKQTLANNDRRFDEADLAMFAEKTGANLNDVKRLAAAVEGCMPDKGCTDDELMRIAVNMAPLYRIDARQVKHAFQQATRFKADLAKFAETTGANLNDVKRLAAAVEKCISEECTGAELMRLTVTMAPRYGIDARHVKHAFAELMRLGASMTPRYGIDARHDKDAFQEALVNEDRRFSETDLIQFAETTGADLNDVKRLAAAVETRTADREYTDDEIMRLAMSMAPRYGISVRHVKQALQQALAIKDRRFSGADLVKFAETTGANLKDVKRLADAVEKCMPEGCTDDKLMRLAMNLAPVYNIESRQVKRAFQQTLANGVHDDRAAIAAQAERKRAWRERMKARTVVY